MRPIRQANYYDYSQVELITVPGRYYSLAELLTRVVRNQPIPMLNSYSDSGHEYGKLENGNGYGETDQVIEDMDQDFRHPFNDPEFEPEDAARYSKYAED